MGNLGDPTEIEREMQEMQEIKEISIRRRRMQELEELQEMEEDEEEEQQQQELNFFEARRFDLIQLSQKIESLEFYVTRYELDVWELELNFQMVSNFMNSLRISKEKAEIRGQEINKARDHLKAMIEKWMLNKKKILREFNELLNLINSANYSLVRKITEINDMIKELDLVCHQIDMRIRELLRTLEAILQSYTFP